MINPCHHKNKDSDLTLSDLDTKFKQFYTTSTKYHKEPDKKFQITINVFQKELY